MVYGIIGLINFAHGEIYMLGAFTALIVACILGGYRPALVGILIVAALVAMVWCSAYGYTIEKVAYKPLRGASRLAPAISAIGHVHLSSELCAACADLQLRALSPPHSPAFHLSSGNGQLHVPRGFHRSDDRVC